jgi:hypothetical protein
VLWLFCNSRASSKKVAICAGRGAGLQFALDAPRVEDAFDLPVSRVTAQVQTRLTIRLKFDLNIHAGDEKVPCSHWMWVDSAEMGERWGECVMVGFCFFFVDKSWLDAEGSGGRLITSSGGGRGIDV